MANDFTRFSEETAAALVSELNGLKGITARVVPPNAIDDYYTVSATLTVRGREQSGTYDWATTPGHTTTAESVSTHLRACLDAAAATAKTMSRFRRAERGNR